MNIRKITNALTHTDVKAIILTELRAAEIRLPLNCLITFHPRETRAMTLKERLAEFRRVRNLFMQFARDNNFIAAYLYVREVALETLAEHMHMLCHVPKKWLAHVRSLVVRWGCELGACEAREASRKGYWSEHGYWFSDLLYIAKQMTPQAKFGRPFRRIGGAAIEGKRWNASRNIKMK